YTAHGLPAAWAIAVIVYCRLVAKWRWLPVAAAAAIALAPPLLVWSGRAHWPSGQLPSALGAYQLWIYGPRYHLLGWVLATLWAWGAIVWFRRKGLHAALADPFLAVCALTALGIGLLPSTIALTRSGHVFAYMAERMALALG